MVIVTFSLFLSAIGCNNCKTDPILLYADKAVEATGIFKPGTYWIYENAATGERDSVVVTAFAYMPDTIFENCKDQQVAVNYTEAYYTYSASDYYAVNYVATAKVGRDLLMARVNAPADTIFSTAACIDTGYCRVFDTLMVFHKKYAAVYQRTDAMSELYQGKTVRFYSAAGYGLIRKEILASDSTWETWNLVHAVIVQ